MQWFFLFLRLLLPGIIGAVLGAVLITQFDGDVMKPFISAYLLLMGLYILRKAYLHVAQRKAPKHVAKLALFGGMFAAPFAAYLCKRIPARTLMTIVGCLITLISAFNIYKALA